MKFNRHAVIALSLGLLCLLQACGSTVSLSEGRQARRELKHDQPLAAAKFRYQQRLSADGTMPANAIIRAKEQRDHLLSSPIDGAGISPDAWTWIGPGNIGGRVRAIIIHPTNHDTVWLGSASGGIWKTTNAGASWAPLDDFMATLSIGCMAIDPTNPNILYAGTGEGFFDAPDGSSNTAAIRGAGIFKTTDGGATWTQMPSTANENWYFVNRLAIHPTNPSIMFAATATGVHRTVDGGNTWEQRTTTSALDVKMDPNNSLRLVAGGNHHGSGPFYSTDGGDTWLAATGIAASDRVELSYAPSVSGMVYAAVSNSNSIRIYRSTDGGQTYVLRSSPGIGTYSAYNNTIWVDPTNSDTLMVGGVFLYRSTNGAASFSSAFSSIHPDHHVMVSHPLYNGGSNRTVYFGHDGGISRTTDAYGASATSLNNNLGVTQFYGIALNPATGVIVGGTQDNGTLRYSGNPQAWQMTFGGDGGFCAADPVDPNYLYGEIYFAQIFRSTNAGQNWSYIHSGITETNRANSNFIPHFIVDPNNANRMLAGCRRLWRTNDVKSGTPTWTAIKPAAGFLPEPPPAADIIANHFEENDPRNISTITVPPGDSNRIYVGHNNGQIYMTLNGQDAIPTWERIDIAGSVRPPARWVSHIVVDPTNPNIVYFSFMGWEPDNVWSYDVTAQQWTSASGTGGDWPLPDVPVSALELHKTMPGWIYAGTDLGIFTSTDGGATWSAATQGPGTVPIDELLWKGDSVLVAATHGRGAFLADVSLAISLLEPVPGIAGQVNELKAGNGTSGRRIHYVYSLRSGFTAVPGCSGVFVDMTRPIIAGDAPVDGNGEATLSLTVPAAAAGQTVRIQAVERATCRVSNVVVFTFQ